MINFHRGGLTKYTRCRSYPMIILISFLGIGTLYPVFFSALAPLSYISFRKGKNHPDVEAKVNYLQTVKEYRLNIAVYHSWTENAWQLTLQMYVLVDETKTVQDLSGKVDSIISILISLGSICYSFSMVVIYHVPGINENFNEIFW